MLCFLLAFAIDRATQQQHSNLLGSAAIAASVLIVWPWQRSIVLDLAAYLGIWLGFAWLRATAPRFDLALARPRTVGDLETNLFAGRLPSSLLQHLLLGHPGSQVLELAAIAIHLSFFIVPTGVALIFRLHGRRPFARYGIATATMLVLATIGFLLLPTAPPWLQAPAQVQRVIVELGRMRGAPLTGNDTPSLTFDPNQLAAMPSVHVAAAALVAFATWCGGRYARLLGGAYGIAMSLSVVYLGEHYALDALGGWLIAAVAWWLATRLVSHPQETSWFPGRPPKPAWPRSATSSKHIG